MATLIAWVFGMLYNQEYFDPKVHRISVPVGPYMQLKHLRPYFSLPPAADFRYVKIEADYILYMSVVIFLCYTTNPHCHEQENENMP